MSRRRLLISVGLILGFVAVVLIGIAAMVKRDPAFYSEADLPPGEERQRQAKEFDALFSRINSVLNEPNWSLTFTTQQINAFFQEDYYRLGGDENLRDGFHAPRVKIDDGKMRVGVRYGSGLFSTVLSMEIKLWRVDNEINTLAMEIVSLQAGSLPLSTGTLLDDISQAARRENIDVTWYRHEGHPVAIMRFQADQTRPTFQFVDVVLKEGELTIYGRTALPTGVAPPPRVVPK
jgi:hypothetical protein